VTITCETGLFVGIDEYRHLKKDEWLRKAQDDARLLYSYFTRVEGNGPWILFEESGRKRLIRLTLIEEVTQWIEQVPEGKAGLFYFAGHAQGDTQGLVLAATDFKPAVPFDSGLPLRRLFELFRRAAVRGKRFVVILDCCRDGIEVPLSADDVPANVSIIYACPLGAKVSEHANMGGALTRVIEKILRDASRRGETRLSLYELNCRTAHALSVDVRAPDPVHELHGSHAEHIVLPMAPAQEEEVADPARSPEIRLEGFNLPPQHLDLAIDQIRAAYVAWFDRNRDDEAKRTEWVASRVLAKESQDSKRLQVILPNTAYPLKPRVLLTSLLSEFPSHFHHLVVTWDRPMDPDLFLPLAKKFPRSNHWIRLPLENASVLVFRREDDINSPNCQMSVIYSSAQTEARLWSEVRGFEPLPLDKLLPELANWLDLLLSID